MVTSVRGLALVSCCCLLAVLAAARMPFVAPLPTSVAPNYSGAYLQGDFSANFTLNEQGITYTGWMVSQLSAKRYFHRVHELNMSTFIFASFNSPVSYEYTVMSSGCTCQVTSGGFVSNLFGPLFAANKATSEDKPASTCTGDLYVNNVLNGLAGVSFGQYCIDDNTPTYVSQGADNSKITTFTNFVSGLSNNYPTEELEAWVGQCNAACI